LELIPLTFIPLPVSGLRPRFHSPPGKAETASGLFSTAYEAVSNHFHSFPMRIEKLPCHTTITGNYCKQAVLVLRFLRDLL
jgi:hypothetical protein